MGQSRCRWLLLALVISGLSTVGSANAADSQPAGKSAAPVQAADPAAQKKLGPAPSKAANAKVNSYIELLNQESESFNRLRHEWLSKIDSKTGPSCKENIALEHTTGPDNGRLETYRKNLKKKPTLPPDAAAGKMVDALQELREIGQEPGPYTEYQGRSQPGAFCKKLKDAYPRMRAIFDKYKQGEREVRVYVDNFTDERDLREAQSTLKKYGKHYRYQFATLTLEGKSMMRTIGAELGKDVPDAGIVKQRFDAFFAIADETKSMMDKEPSNQKKEPFPDVFKFFLTESVPKIKRASVSLSDVLAQKPDKKWEERLDSAWKSVVGGYNEMVGYMNQMHFDAKQK